MLFYAARYAVLVVLFVWEGVNALVGLALLIFYLVKKQMPYDFVPYEDSAGIGAGASATTPTGPVAPAVPPVPTALQNGASDSFASASGASAPLSNPDPTATQTQVIDGSTHNQDSPTHPTV